MYYCSETELIIGVAVAVVLLVASYIAGKKRHEKVFANLLGKSVSKEKQALDMLSAAQLYNSAWFLSVGSSCEMKKKHLDELEEDVIRRGGHVDRWGHPDPEEALDSEEEMMFRCSKAETEYEAVRIISLYVPKTIEKIVYSKDYIEELPKNGRKKFKALCDKYCISTNR